MPAGAMTEPIVVGRLPKTCDCVELRIEWFVKDERTGKLLKYVRYLPPNPYHDCEYVRLRNALIPLAVAAADENRTTYPEEMDRLVVERGLVVKF